jgi:ATP-dependent helicase/nuclease subunit A
LSLRSAGPARDADVVRLPLPDEAARARIRGGLDINLLVEAGAGSGKTTELISRMVALIETGTSEADEIAAVTFTRKAAGELRERFQAGIEHRLSEYRGRGDVDSTSFERLSRGLDDIDRTFIGTIHAFCSRLLRERPLEIGLDPAFEEMAIEERITLRRRFWQAYLERLTRESDPILEDLARAGLKPLSLYRLFDAVVENPDVEFRADPSAPGSPEELGAFRTQLVSLVERAWELMPDRVPEADWDPLQKKLRTLHFSLDVTGWVEPAELYEAIGTLCKPANPHTITQNRWRERAQAVALRDAVNAFGVGDTPARMLHLRWLAHRYALAMRLARHAAVEFAAHRRRIGKLDFEDLLVLAAELLRTNPGVRRDLGRRYRRLLVDEFQDTDPLQAEIMLLLSSEPDVTTEGREGASSPTPGVPAVPGVPAWRTAVPRPGALFVVGDPKQSIYRFRRADIQLYALVKDRFREFGDVVELTTNFRSRPPIGDLVNELFPRAGFFPDAATPEQAAFEPLNTRPPTAAVSAEGVFHYRLTPPEKNAHAAARDDAERIASWIRGRVDMGERRPGDFLILTRMKGRIDVYARALEAQALPVEVTGAGIGAEDEIRELVAVLECLIDPTNPVKVVAALVGLGFGIDYERLITHRLDGGGLDAMRPGERGHADVLDALRTLHAWWRAASAEPADIFVPRLVREIGLLPLAAAGDLGAVRAGALLYAMDAIRSAALAGDASLPGAITAMLSALSLAEAEAPLEPSKPDVVRLMNLHQAKGLEATVVVLADPSGGREHAPDLHIERGDDGRAVGYARVTEASEGRGGAKDLARPADWDDMAQIESRFDAAEGVRLLYVAVTRAKEELIVARWPDKSDVSPWRALHSWLDDRAELLELEARPARPREEIEATASDIGRVTAQAAGTITAMRTPSYLHRSVTDVAKATLAAERSREPERASVASSEELRGFSWGSAVHGALAAAARAPGVEPLRATCRDLLVEHGRPLDDHGEPTEIEELTRLVRAVQASDLWARAMRAERMMSEVAFSVPGWTVAVAGEAAEAGRKRLADGKRQLDLFGGLATPASTQADASASQTAEPPMLLEGVIDLVFREPGGWVVADYKTDVGTDPEFAGRESAYRRQVDLYAEAWARLTGEPVKERVLLFTSQGRAERW